MPTTSSLHCSASLLLARVGMEAAAPGAGAHLRQALSHLPGRASHTCWEGDRSWATSLPLRLSGWQHQPAAPGGLGCVHKERRDKGVGSLGLRYAAPSAAPGQWIPPCMRLRQSTRGTSCRAALGTQQCCDAHCPLSHSSAPRTAGVRDMPGSSPAPCAQGPGDSTAPRGHRAGIPPLTLAGWRSLLASGVAEMMESISRHSAVSQPWDGVAGMERSLLQPTVLWVPVPKCRALPNHTRNGSDGAFICNPREAGSQTLPLRGWECRKAILMPLSLSALPGAIGQGVPAGCSAPPGLCTRAKLLQAPGAVLVELLDDGGERGGTKGLSGQWSIDRMNFTHFFWGPQGRGNVSWPHLHWAVQELRVMLTCFHATDTTRMGRAGPVTPHVPQGHSQSCADHGVLRHAAAHGRHGRV